MEVLEKKLQVKVSRSHSLRAMNVQYFMTIHPIVAKLFQTFASLRQKIIKHITATITLHIGWCQPKQSNQLCTHICVSEVGY